MEASGLRQSISPNGSHQYKLVVNGNYITDPGNPFTAPDGFGGYNSKLAVGPLDEAVTSVTTMKATNWSQPAADT